MLAPDESLYMSAHTIYQYANYGTIWQVDTVFGMHWCGQPQSQNILRFNLATGIGKMVPNYYLACGHQ